MNMRNGNGGTRYVGAEHDAGFGSDTTAGDT